MCSCLPVNLPEMRKAHSLLVLLAPLFRQHVLKRRVLNRTGDVTKGAGTYYMWMTTSPVRCSPWILILCWSPSKHVEDSTKASVSTKSFLPGGCKQRGKYASFSGWFMMFLGGNKKEKKCKTPFNNVNVCPQCPQCNDLPPCDWLTSNLC